MRRIYFFILILFSAHLSITQAFSQATPSSQATPTAPVKATVLDSYNTSFSNAGSSPSIDSKGIVYFISNDRQLNVVRLNSLGKFELLDKMLLNRAGTATPLITSNGTIVIANGGSLYTLKLDGNNKLELIDEKFPCGSNVNTYSPVLFGKNKLIVTCQSYYIYLYEMSDAGKLSYLDIGKTVNYNYAAPNVTDKGMIIASAYRGFHFFKIEGNRLIDMKELSVNYQYAQAAVLDSDTVLLPSNDLSVANISSTSVIKAVSTSSFSPTGNFTRSSPVIDKKGLIYIASNSGYVYALKLENGNLVKIAEYYNATRRKTYHSSIMSPDGVLFVTSTNSLDAFKLDSAGKFEFMGSYDSTNSFSNIQQAAIGPKGLVYIFENSGKLLALDFQGIIKQAPLLGTTSLAERRKSLGQLSSASTKGYPDFILKNTLIDWKNKANELSSELLTEGFDSTVSACMSSIINEPDFVKAACSSAMCMNSLEKSFLVPWNKNKVTDSLTKKLDELKSIGSQVKLAAGNRCKATP